MPNTAPLFVMWDFETTGIPAQYPGQIRPVQVGISLRNSAWEEQGFYQAKMCPDTWAKGYQRAESIHKLRRADLEAPDVPRMRGAFLAMLHWLVDSTQGAPLRHMSWSAKFDMEVLRLWAEDGAGLSLSGPLYPWQDAAVGSLTAPLGCAQALFRNWTKTQDRVKTPRYGSLKSACEVLGVDRDEAQAHGALYDARLASRVMRELLSRSQ